MGRELPEAGSEQMVESRKEPMGEIFLVSHHDARVVAVLGS